MPNACRRWRLVRVSSVKIRSTLRNTSMTRGLRSWRLPIGVATIYKTPGSIDTFRIPLDTVCYASNKLPSMHTFSRLVIAVLILSSVGACASLSLTREDRVLEGRTTHAQVRMRAGDFIGAASEYLRLAQASRAPASYKYVLHATEAYLAGRRVDEAKQLLIRLQIPA